MKKLLILAVLVALGVIAARRLQNSYARHSPGQPGDGQRSGGCRPRVRVPAPHAAPPQDQGGAGHGETRRHHRCRAPHPVAQAHGLVKWRTSQPRSRAILASARSGLTATGRPTASSIGRSVAESE